MYGVGRMFVFVEQKTAYEFSACLVGSWMCIGDRLWLHRESPPIYETCRPCFDAMRAAGIDNEMWKARVRRERDQLISEQAAAAETAKTGQS